MDSGAVSDVIALDAIQRKDSVGEESVANARECLVVIAKMQSQGCITCSVK